MSTINYTYPTQRVFYIKNESTIKMFKKKLL